MRGVERRWLARGVASLMALLMGGSVGGAQTVERLVGTGDPGPFGLPISAVLAPAEGPAREIVFLSRTTAVFRRGTGGLEAELAAGVSVPDGMVAGVGTPTLDELGCAIMVANLVGGAQGLYAKCDATVTRLVGAGDATSGGDVILRLELEAPVAAAGAVAFVARLASGVEAVLRVSGGVVTEIARPGDPVPSGGVLSSLRLAGLDAGGRVGIRASVSGGSDGLFTGTGGSLNKALIEGDATLVGRLDSIEQATLAASSLWVFVGRLDDDRLGVFRFNGQAPLPLVEALAMVGDGVPTRPGTTIRDIPRSQVPSVNTSGDVAFRATLEGNQGGAALFATRGAAVPELLFSTRDTTNVGLLARLRDPQIADDGSVLFAATPNRDGAGVFVHRAGRVSALARFGVDTDIGLSDQRFRFTGGCVRVTAESGVISGEHDVVTRQIGGGEGEVIASMGGPSPIGGQLAELGNPQVDSKGRVLFRASVAGATRAEGVFVVSEKGIADRAVSGDRVRGGRLGDIAELAPELGGDLSVVQRLGAVAASIEDGRANAGLFLVKGGRPRRLERSGRTFRGIGEIVALGTRPALVAGKRYAFRAEVRDGSTREAVIARRRKRRLVVREGDETGTRLAGRFRAFTVPDATTLGIVFRATSTTEAEGIMVDDWEAPRLVLATGDAVEAGESVQSLGRPVIAGESVYTTAVLEDGGTLIDSLLGVSLASGSGTPEVETLLRSGDAIPGGGVLLDLVSIRGTVRGSILGRAGVVGGSGHEALLRVTPSNLDPPGPSQ